ncbi:hypothetical protein MTO96_022537 [Rhipicephalus appendiculatus]
MPVLLYNLVGSPPCGFIRCLAKEIGVELNLRDLDFAKGEHRSEEFLKINPFHKVPTIDDNGFVVYESNAIAYYLLRNGNIHPNLGAFFRPRYFQGTKPSADEVKAFEENVLNTLERLVGENKFAVGDKITIADLCLIGHVTVCLEVPCIDKAKYPKLAGYYNRVKGALPYFEEIFGPVLVQINKVWEKAEVDASQCCLRKKGSRYVPAMLE